jgi:heme/copper-type cytochrome/quinol oxidase subunit 2
MPVTVRRLSAVLGWLLLALAGLAIGLWPAPAAAAAQTDRHFRVEASQFAYAPATLYANLGDRITIDVVATDVEHGLYLDGYDLNVIAQPGQTAHLTFIADRAGMFRFRCSVTCGALHPFMIGKLNVGPNWLLVRAIGLAVLAVIAGVWVARRPAPPARDDWARPNRTPWGVCPR